MSRFERMNGLQGLASNPPQLHTPRAEDGEAWMRDEIASIQNLKTTKLMIDTDIDLGLTEEESGNG